MRTKLKKSWQLRNNRQIEDCMEVFVEIKRDLGFPLGIFNSEVIREYVTCAEKMEVLFLASSLSRAKMDMDHSNMILDAASLIAQEKGLKLPFHYYMEKGINLFTIGDYANALEFFIGASQLSELREETIQAELNTLLCLENLALPCEKTLRKLEDLFKGGNKTKEFNGVLNSFYNRENYRKGNLKAIFAKRNGGDTDLEKFYYNWLRELPYHQYFKNRDEKSENKLSSQFHQGLYRRRTILGLSLIHI